MISYSTLIFILANMLIVASVISLMVVFLAGGLALLLILSINKQTDAAYNRYVRETAPDSGYSVYYNGQAVSESTLCIDSENFGNFDIKYDEKNKIIKIMQKR